MQHDYLQDAFCKTTWGTSKFNASVGRAIGFYQFLSSKNNLGKFVPGTYSCNSVSMYRISAFSDETEFSKQKVLGKDFEASGDFLAYAAAMSYHYELQLERAWSSLLQQEAVNKSYAKIMKSDLDVGEMVAELKETVEGLINPLKGLRTLIKQYNSLKKTSDLKRLADLADAGSSTWLEWRYGIRPLIQSIQDIIESVNSQTREFNGKMRKRRGQTSVKQSLRKVSFSTSAGHVTFSGEMIISTKKWCTASAAYTLPSPLTVEERYGLDILSLPGIAWERVPLSFVVDWFLNVGQWLDALKTYVSKATIHGVSVTTRWDTEIKVNANSYLVYGAKVTPSIPGSFSVVCQAMERRCLPPGFNVVTPALNSQVLDLQKILDLVTLTYQRLPKPKR